MNAMLNPKSTLQKAASLERLRPPRRPLSGAINNNSNNNAKRLSFEGIEKTLNASTNRTTITTSTSNNSNTILHGFSNATRFHPMALASSSLARATYAAIVSRARDSWKSGNRFDVPNDAFTPVGTIKVNAREGKDCCVKNVTTNIRRSFDSGGCFCELRLRSEMFDKLLSKEAPRRF